MLLLGLGFALAYPSVNMAATNGIDDHEQGLASGLVQHLVPARRRARPGDRHRGGHGGRDRRRDSLLDGSGPASPWSPASRCSG